MTDKQLRIVQKTAVFVRRKFEHDQSGHDWYHMERVWKMARRLAEAEGADLFIVEMAALLHDYADWKLEGDQQQAKQAMLEWLRSQAVPQKDIERIVTITENVSFKGLTHKAEQSTLEGRVVQDADRLDAIGAIAIARVFAFGGHKGRLIYDPEDKVFEPLSDEAYQGLNKQNTRSGIHHFYDKLLHLKERINTPTAKKIAEGRHRYMEEYVARFLAEWKGER
jgi:uncharacterized protein